MPPYSQGLPSPAGRNRPGQIDGFSDYRDNDNSRSFPGKHAVILNEAQRKEESIFFYKNNEFWILLPKSRDQNDKKPGMTWDG
jgi:hypothetical protein